MTTIAQRKPAVDEYEAYYQPYMDLVTESDLLIALESQIAEVTETLNLDESAASTIHDPYSWTIKQVVGHMIDNERVFAYRAMRFAVADSTDLPGYDQDDYVAESDYESVSLEALTQELVRLRKSNLMMLRRIQPESWSFRGRCDGREITVRAIACLLVGHVRHHLQIIERRLGG